MTYCTYEKASFQDEAKQRDHLPTAQPTHAQSPHEQHPIATSRVASQPHANPWCSVPSPQHMTPRDRVELNIAQSKAIDALFTPSKPHQSTQSQENRAVVRNQPHYAPTMHDQIFAALKGQSPGQKTASQSAALCKEPAPAAQSTQSQENRAVARNQPHYAPTMHDQIFAALKGQSPGQKPAPQSAPLCKAPVQTPISNSQTQPPSQSPAPSHSPTPASTPDCVDSASQANSPKGTRHAKPKRQKQSSNHAEPTRDITKMTAPREAQAESLRIQSSIHGKSILDGPKRPSFGLGQSPQALRSQKPSKDELKKSALESDETTRSSETTKRATKTATKHSKHPNAPLRSSRSAKAPKSSTQSHQSPKASRTPASSTQTINAMQSGVASKAICAWPKNYEIMCTEAGHRAIEAQNNITQNDDTQTQMTKAQFSSNVLQCKEQIDLDAYKHSSQPISFDGDAQLACFASTEHLDEQNHTPNINISSPNLEEGKNACLNAIASIEQNSNHTIQNMQNNMQCIDQLQSIDWSSISPKIEPQDDISAEIQKANVCSLNDIYTPLLTLDDDTVSVYDTTKHGMQSLSLLQSNHEEMLKTQACFEDELIAEQNDFMSKETQARELGAQKEKEAYCRFDEDMKKGHEESYHEYKTEVDKLDNETLACINNLYNNANSEIGTEIDKFEREKAKVNKDIDHKIEEEEQNYERDLQRRQSERENDEECDSKDSTNEQETKKEASRYERFKAGLKKGIRVMFQVLNPIATAVIHTIRFIAKNLSTDVYNAIQKFYNHIDNIISSVVDFFEKLAIKLFDVLCKVINDYIDDIIETIKHIALTFVKYLTLGIRTFIAACGVISGAYDSKAEALAAIFWPTLDAALTFAGVQSDMLHKFKDVSKEIVQDPKTFWNSLKTSFSHFGTAFKNTGWAILPKILDGLVKIWLPKANVSFPTHFSIPSLAPLSLELCGIKMDAVLKGMGIEDEDELNDMSPDGPIPKFIARFKQEGIGVLFEYIGDGLIGLASDMFKDICKDMIQKAAQKIFAELISIFVPFAGILEMAKLVGEYLVFVRKYAKQINALFDVMCDILFQCARGRAEGLGQAMFETFIASAPWVLHAIICSKGKNPSEKLEKWLESFRKKVKSILPFIGKKETDKKDDNAKENANPQQTTNQPDATNPDGSPSAKTSPTTTDTTTNQTTTNDNKADSSTPNDKPADKNADQDGKEKKLTRVEKRKIARAKEANPELFEDKEPKKENDKSQETKKKGKVGEFIDKKKEVLKENYDQKKDSMREKTKSFASKNEKIRKFTADRIKLEDRADIAGDWLDPKARTLKSGAKTLKNLAKKHKKARKHADNIDKEEKEKAEFLGPLSYTGKDDDKMSLVDLDDLWKSHKESQIIAKKNKKS